MSYSSSSLMLNPITYGGGGGAFGPDHQIIEQNPKTALSSTSELGDFYFYLLDTFWQNFCKIDSPGGCCSCFFVMRRLEKLNMQLFLFCFKTMELHMWV